MIVTRLGAQLDPVVRGDDRIGAWSNDLDARAGVREHRQLQGRRHVGNGALGASGTPDPTTTFARGESPGERVPFGGEVDGVTLAS